MQWQFKIKLLLMEFLIRYSNEVKWIEFKKKERDWGIVELLERGVEGFPFESQIYAILSIMTS